MAAERPNYIQGDHDSTLFCRACLCTFVVTRSGDSASELAAIAKHERQNPYHHPIASRTVTAPATTPAPQEYP